MHNLSAAMDGIKVNLSFTGSFSQEQLSFAPEGKQSPQTDQSMILY